jgi:ribosomal subunit interface protein
MVHTTYAYKNFSAEEKSFLESYLPKKSDRLDTLMKRFSSGDCRLAVRSEKFVTNAAYKIEMSLHLPGHILLAEEDDHTVIEAADLALDKLIIQLRKLVEKKKS